MSFLEEQFLNSSSIFASFFIVMTHNSSVNFGCLNSYFGLKDPIKVPNLRVSSALVKTCHIPHVIFETTSQFFFKSQTGWNFSWRVGSLKFCPLMGLFCPNHIKFQLKKVPSSYLSWHRRVNAKFKEKLTCGFKYNMSNLVNFHPTIKKPENFFLMGSFYLKYTRFELQKCRGVIFHGTEQWCKIWINPDFVISKMTWGIGWNFIGALKNLKNYTFMGSFCTKHIMFQLENFIGIMCHDSKRWCKI